jgi:hypothetical protein
MNHSFLRWGAWIPERWQKGSPDGPRAKDALIDAVECVILAHWQPRSGDTAGEIDNEDVAELYRVFHALTGWVPTEAEQAAARTTG